MNCNSTLGPDGFGLAFYQATWAIIKPMIMQFMAAFQRGEANLERINISYMVLLLNKPGSFFMDAFRPICLQNCNVKTLAKVLTRRLQRKIPKLADLNQTCFIKERSTSEGFVYATKQVQVSHKRKHRLWCSN